jgi:hypothetical protein
MLEAQLLHGHLLSALLAILFAGAAGFSIFVFGTTSVPNRAPNLLAANGAIPLPPAADGLYHITKSTAGAFTLALPTTDGIRMSIVSETAAAHVITCGGSPPSGLNAANGTLTYAATAGSGCELISRNGRWYTLNLNGVTVS